jgi:hypothetical protein
MAAVGGASISIWVDTRDLARVNAAFREVSGEMRRKIIPESLNKGGYICLNRVKQNLVQETGLPAGQISAALHAVPATAGRYRFMITAKGGYTRVGFGARQVGAGAAHRAWGRTQIARGAFVHRGQAFIRTTSNRYPIRPLFGPSIPREVERGKSQEIVNATAASVCVPMLLNACDAAIMSAGAKRGLTRGARIR